MAKRMVKMNKLNIILFGLLIFLFSEIKAQDEPRFWVWANGKDRTEQEWDTLFFRIHNAGIEALLLNADTAILKEAIPFGKKYGIEVHAWFWTMNRGEADPSWLSYNALNKSLADEKAYVNYYKFMCPALPEVKEYLKSRIDRLATVEGLSGIHFDYIRYVDVILPLGLQPKYGLKQDSIMPEFDYGYHPYMRKLFKDSTGVDPFELEDYAHDSTWIQFRLDRLNETVIMLRDHVRSKGLESTAAVFPTPHMSTEMVRQPWDAWGLDAFFPMVYANFYNESHPWIKEVMIENRQALPNAKIFCGLYVPSLKAEGEMQKAFDAAMDGGANGVAFFDYNAMNDQMMAEIKKLIEAYYENLNSEE